MQIQDFETRKSRYWRQILPISVRRQLANTGTYSNVLTELALLDISFHVPSRTHTSYFSSWTNRNSPVTSSQTVGLWMRFIKKTFHDEFQSARKFHSYQQDIWSLQSKSCLSSSQNFRYWSCSVACCYRCTSKHWCFFPWSQVTWSNSRELVSTNRIDLDLHVIWVSYRLPSEMCTWSPWWSW